MHYANNEVDRAGTIIKTLKVLIDEINEPKNHAHFLLARGKVLEIAQSFSSAALLYSQSYREDRKNYEALARLAATKIKMGDHVESLSLARELVDLAPKQELHTITGLPITTQAILGDALRVTGDGHGALSAYRQSVKISGGQDQYSIARAASLALEGGDIDLANSLAESMTNKVLVETIEAVTKLAERQHGQPSISSLGSVSVGVLAADIAV